MHYLTSLLKKANSAAISTTKPSSKLEYIKGCPYVSDEVLPHVIKHCSAYGITIAPSEEGFYSNLPAIARSMIRDFVAGYNRAQADSIVSGFQQDIDQLLDLEICDDKPVEQFPNGLRLDLEI